MGNVEKLERELKELSDEYFEAVHKIIKAFHSSPPEPKRWESLEWDVEGDSIYAHIGPMVRWNTASLTDHTEKSRVLLNVLARQANLLPEAVELLREGQSLLRSFKYPGLSDMNTGGEIIPRIKNWAERSYFFLAKADAGPT